MIFPETSVVFSTSDDTWQRVFDAAENVEKQNIKTWNGRRVLVEGGIYNGLWLETQPMGGEMYASRDVDVAMNNQLFFMENVREDGRIPSVLHFNNGKMRISYSHFQGYCFPYHALNLWYLSGKDPDYLNDLYRVLSGFDDYLWRTRDTDGNGCLESFCVWDTGEDSAARFFGGPNSWESDEPPYGQARLPYESMDVMAYSYDGCITLAEISEILGNGERRKWLNRAAQTKKTLNSYLWREEKGALYDRDCDNLFLDTLIHNNLRVMYHGAYEANKAVRFVNEHLLNENEFFTPMPLTSVAANDPLFISDPDNNWSGQPEGLTYQRSVRALENYGFSYLVPVFGHKLCDALAMNDPVLFTQQFDPFTCVPQAARASKNGDYGPTALAFLNFTTHMYGVEYRRDRLIWSSLGDSGGCEYTQRIGNNAYTIKNDGTKASGEINGRTVFTVPCGHRVVTDLKGTVRFSEKVFG